jgi:hypothetical protein
MLGRLRELVPGVPAVLARAEALPFTDSCVELVCGAQMWHWWTCPPRLPKWRGCSPRGGRLCLWWNEGRAHDQPWWQAQQGADRSRQTPGGAGPTAAWTTARSSMRTGLFASVEVWDRAWQRELDCRSTSGGLRSKSYVQGVGDLEAFLEAERAALQAAFPDGRSGSP